MSTKIALVGCGTWGRNILRDLRILDCIVDVFETNEQTAEGILELGAYSFKLGLPEDSSYDGIVLATPSSTHREILERINRLNVPVFVEKPLTTSLKDALFLQTILHENIFLMHVWLYHPGILMLSEIAQTRELGRLMSVRSRRCNWTSPRKDTDSIWNLAPHDITICQSILGYVPEPIFSLVERYSNNSAKGMMAVLGTNPNFIFEVSNRYETKIREVRLHCENGVAILKDEKVDYIEIYKGDDLSTLESVEYEKRSFSKESALLIELREFVNYLGGGPSPRSSFEQGLKVVSVIDRLIEIDLDNDAKC